MMDCLELVQRLRAEPYWVGGSQQQSEGDSNSAPFEAADFIERQRKALREAREWIDEASDPIKGDVLATIDTVLGGNGG